MFSSAPLSQTTIKNPIQFVEQINQVNVVTAQMTTEGLSSRVSALSKLLLNEKSKSLPNHKAIEQHLRQVQHLSEKITAKLLPAVNHFCFQEKKSKTENQPTKSQQLVQLRQRNNLKLQHFEKTLEQLSDFFNQNKNNWIMALSDPNQQTAVMRLFKALSIYENLIQDSLFISSSSQTLASFSYNTMIALQEQLVRIQNGSKKQECLKLIRNTQQLAFKAANLYNQFQTLSYNDKPFLELFSSSMRKHNLICEQLSNMDLSHSELLLALAERHKTPEIVDQLINEIDQIQTCYDTNNAACSEFFADCTGFLSDDSAPQPPLESKSSLNRLHSPQRLSQQQEKITVPNTPQPANTKDKPALTPNTQAVTPIDTLEIQLSIEKRLEWFKSDLKQFTSTNPDLSQHDLVTQLTELAQVIEYKNQNDWPKQTEQIQTQQTTLEQELLDLEHQLNKLSFSTEKKQPLQATTRNTPTGVTTNQTTNQNANQSTHQTDPTSTQKPLDTTPIEPKTLDATQPIPLNTLLNRSTDLIYKLGLKINHYSNLQQTLQNSLLQDSVFSPLWANVYEAQVVINQLNASLHHSMHQALLVPFLDIRETIQTVHEMIRFIQIHKTHPHFDEYNARDFLEYIPHWVNDFEPHFRYLDTLLNGSFLNQQNTKH